MMSQSLTLMRIQMKILRCHDGMAEGRLIQNRNQLNQNQTMSLIQTRNQSQMMIAARGLSYSATLLLVW